MLYEFPKDLRKWSANPKNLHGLLFPGDPSQALPRLLKWITQDRLLGFYEKKIPHKRDIILIGDVVSDFVLNLDEIRPFIKYAIFDDKTQQGVFEYNHPRIPWKMQSMQNPDGFLNSEILEFIKLSISDQQPYLISITGEEDLLVIAAVLHTYNAYIVYGQPPITSLEIPIPAGAVVIKVTDEVKQLYQSIFQRMSSIHN